MKVPRKRSKPSRPRPEGRWKRPPQPGCGSSGACDLYVLAALFLLAFGPFRRIVL